MPVILIVIVMGITVGALIGVQSPMASMISQKLGTLESVFIVHIGGALASLALLLVLKKGGNLSGWRELPWYVLMAGALGVLIVGSMGYLIPKVGVATTTLLVFTGQLITGAALDHFGLLGAEVRPLTLPRLAGFVVMALGVWLVVRR